MKTQKTIRNIRQNVTWILTSLIFCGLLSATSISLAAVGEWTRVADMPTPRYGHGVSAVNGVIYAIGGRDSSALSVVVVEEYDPKTDTWAKKAPMPTPRSHFYTAVVNDKIYAIGGVNWLSGVVFPTVEEYDPATDTWTKKSDMPTARHSLSLSVVDGKIYAIGGSSGATVEVYDPATDSWTKKADMPTPREYLFTGVVNGKIYAIGGKYYSGFTLITVTTVEEYDPQTDTWTKKADMPTPRNGLSGGVVNGKIYVVTGWTSAGVAVRAFEVYDPATDIWTKAEDIPTGRTARSTVVDGNIYAIGGAIASFTPTGTVEVYDTGFSDLLGGDSTPPARITDLEVVELQPTPEGISYASLTLRWTAPGDDGNQGQAHHYDIRYSTTPTTRVNELTQLVSEEVTPKPVKSGQEQTAEIEGLESGTHYFGVLAYDEGSNLSLSNVLEVKVPLNLLSDATHAFQFGDSKYPSRGSMALCLDQDMNGTTDLYLVSDELYINQGGGQFEELPGHWDLRDSRAEVAAVADYDNNGELDILTTTSDQLQLYQHARVFYQDTASEAGLKPDILPEWVTFVDINGDNWLDIYMSVRNEPSLVYLNNGDSTFTENAATLGLDFKGAETVLFSDLNGDNRVDAYIPDDWVYFQEQDGHFAVDKGAGILPYSITDACVGDYDNDGDMDVYVVNDGEANSLYQNNGLGQFEDVTQQTKTGDEGDGITANFVDINNDGMLDLYVLNRDDPSVLYIQQSDGTFEAYRDPEELDLQRPNSAAFGDFDGDGDVDIHVTQGSREPGRMYRNNSEGNHWLHVKVVGTLSNTDALGAKVYVTTPDGTQMREVRSQTGWSSDSLPVEFGLGAHSKADTVDIRWPSGQWQSLHNVSADAVLTVEEGDMRWATTWGDIRRTALLQNFPNPFNPDTWIPFVLAQDSVVTLNIFDISGRLVRRLSLGVQQAGVYTKRGRAIHWDGRNTNGERVSSGVYFYQLTAGDFSATRKMVIVK